MNDASTSEHAGETWVLDDPRRNKGTALTAAGRQQSGLLPHPVGETCLEFSHTAHGGAKPTMGLFAAGVQLPDVKLSGQQFYPGQADVLQTGPVIATAVAGHMLDQRLAAAERPGDLRAWIEAMPCNPECRAEA